MESLKSLTVDQKNLLYETWGFIAKDKDKLGICIFEMIFRVSPNAKRFFNFPESDYESGTEKSEKFQFHSIQFVKVMAMSLSRLNGRLEELQALLHMLGSAHANIKGVPADVTAARRMKRLPLTVFNASYYWTVFNDSALIHIKALLEAGFDKDRIDEAMAVWRTLILAISNMIKQGYQLAKTMSPSVSVDDG